VPSFPGTVSEGPFLFASLVMLFITYYTTFWFCILLIMSFNYLVNEFDFSPGETYLVVIDGGYNPVSGDYLHMCIALFCVVP
jgi:hypothetical protein